MQFTETTSERKLARSKTRRTSLYADMISILGTTKVSSISLKDA